MTFHSFQIAACFVIHWNYTRLSCPRHFPCQQARSSRCLPTIHRELIKMFVAVNLIMAFHCSGLCRGSPLLPLQKCRGSMEMIKFFPFLVEVVSQPWFQVASAFNAEQLYRNRSVVSFHSLNENTRKCSSMCDTTFTFPECLWVGFSQDWGLCKGWELAMFPSLPSHLWLFRQVVPTDPRLMQPKSIPMLRDLAPKAAATQHWHSQGGKILQKEDVCARKVVIV